MSITKLKSVGPWPMANNDIHHAGATLGGRRVIVGMLTGTPPAGPEPKPVAPAAPRKRRR